jgi:phospholipid transport system substrate-binding protein
MHKGKLLGWFALALVIAVPASVFAGVPTEQVRQTADRVQALLQDSRLKGADKQKERRAQLREILATRFDFAEMAKRSLGSHWQRVNGDDQQRFVKLFTELLERSYVGQIESYDGEKILYGKENVDQNQAEVETKLVSKKGEQLAVNYKLQNGGGDWKVYDVVIENISLVNNFRSQFNRILANASFADLLQKLESKSVDIKAARS